MEGVCAAGHRLDLGGLGKKQRAMLTPLVSGHQAFGLLGQGESVLWASQPVDAPSRPQPVRAAAMHITQTCVSPAAELH